MLKLRTWNPVGFTGQRSSNTPNPKTKLLQEDAYGILVADHT